MYGTLDARQDGRWQLRFVRTLAHSPDRVWRAITEPEHLAAWFPTTIEGERKAGAPLRFSFPSGEAEAFDGEILVYQPPHVLEFRWGTDTLRLELQAVEAGTRLTLIDTLDQRGKAARDGAGWHVCLDSLEAHLQGQPDARQRMATWGDVHPHYVQRFGAEAATIGPPDGR